MKYINIHIFKSKIINKIKDKTTNISYEKSRLIIQTYNNNNKNIILIQSLTI
jgi:hypothetical protein